MGRAIEHDATLVGEVDPSGDNPILAVASGRIEAGPPRDNDCYAAGRVDLARLVMGGRRPPSTTFVYRIGGDSMSGAGINDGDFVIADTSVTPEEGDTVIARVDGGFTIKELRLRPRPLLLPHNPAYQAIELTPEQDISIVGKVIAVVRRC
ncbi:MAG: UV protection and mutation protein [Succinivibrionaceae bacterium]|nr:UV protection and mutation protein [Succinivibrionaceae bacterium]